ncbi:MAG: FG-GAP-like repeat-containing protein [Actinomycetota bacterium]
MRLNPSTLIILLAVLATTLSPSPAAAASSNSFVDDDNSRFEPFIETAKQAGLVSGCNPPDNDRVCPHHPVTRGGLAIMLARAIGAQPSSTNHFNDDDGHVAEGAINGLADAGISTGCDKDRFCPDRQISRGEMAALITRAFEWDQQADPDQYVDLDDTPFDEPLVKLAARRGLLACDPPVNQRLCPEASVRRDEAVYALVSALGLQPAINTARPATDGPALDFGDGFYDLGLWDGSYPSSRNRVSITSGGFHETGLRVRIPKGSHYGADFKLKLEDAADVVPERLFFRYYLKLDPDWRTTSSGKLPGFSGVYGSTGKGGYQSSPDEPGWSARLMFGPNHTTDDRVDLGYYVYHLGQETRYGEGLGWNEAGKLRPGDWYCLEGEVDINTPGLADGALRAWVDGTPAFDLSGLEFRRPDEPQIKIESFWFNVYHGGKAVAPQYLGMTIDEVMVDTERVGCGPSKIVAESVDGDFNGDGFGDRVSWEENCPDGTCFRLETSHWNKVTASHQGDDGIWFSQDSRRIGMASGDVNGDNRADIVYHGRCDLSIECWRVHDGKQGLTDGSNWGDGARFSENTVSLTLGDWNGDGFDDLAYQGICSSDNRPCWRVHTSDGKRFNDAKNWGATPETAVTATAVDVNGNGRDDLVYQAPCEESHCWFAQISADGTFQDPVALGPAMESSTAGVSWIDFDGDTREDLVTWVNSADGSWVEVRHNEDLELGSPVTLMRLESEIENVALRRLQSRETVQAAVAVSCDDNEPCVENFVAAPSRGFVDINEFMEMIRNRPGGPRIQ